MCQVIKQHLLRAQQRMKVQADCDVTPLSKDDQF
jgi:hypothetical protein